MRKSTFTKGLFTTLALSLCMTGAMATVTDASLNATVQYTLGVDDYLKITTTTPTVNLTTAIDEDYSALSIESPGIARFQVISNATTRNIYLQGKTSVTGVYSTLFSQAGTADDLYLIFTKDGAGTRATAATVEAAKGATPAASATEDTIWFKVTVTAPTHDIYQENSGITAAWDSTATKGQVIYTMKNGTGTFQYSVGGAAGAFSLHDTAGTYKAQLYMTNTTL